MNAALWLVGTTSLLVGLLAGFFMHRSDFCLAGAFRDLFLFRSARMIRVLVLLILVSAVLFEASRLLGWLPHYPFPNFYQPSLANLIGGVFFGIGMVLAGGCVVGVLYKLGGGSVLAGVALLGLLVGSGLYAEFHPWWVHLAKAMRLHGQAVTLPQLTDASPLWWLAPLLLIGGWLCWRWRSDWVLTGPTPVEGYIRPWVTALVLAVLGWLSVLGTALPMGVTSPYAKAAAYLEQLVAPQHVASLSFFTAQPVRFKLPFGGPEMSGGAGPVFDVMTLTQGPLVIGIILGALLSALLLGEFHPHWRVQRRQVGMVFAGGVIMALGSRMTPGCNVWHLLGGLPLLTMQSLLFLLGMLPGAWLGGLLFVRLTVK